MIDGDRRHHRNGAVGHVGVVPGPAHADLKHADIHGRVGEHRERHADEHLKERQPDVVRLVDDVQIRLDLVVRGDEPLGVQRLPVDADALADRRQVRASEQARPQAARSQ